jgi:ATP-binding cassette subfamily B protein
MKDFKEVSKGKGDFKLFIRMAKYVIPHLKELGISVLMMIFSLVIELLPSLLIGLCISIVSNENYSSELKLTYVLLIVGVFLILILISAVVTYVHNILLQKVGQKIVTQLRGEVFTHITYLSNNQINEVPVGKLMTRVINDTNSVSELFTSVILSMIKSILTIIIIAIVLMVLDVQLSLLVFITLPLMLIATVVFDIVSRKIFRNNKNYASNINGFLAENLSGIKMTQVFNQQEKKRKEFLVKNGAVRNGFFAQVMCFAIYQPVVYVITMIGTLITLYFGMDHLILGLIGVPMLISFIDLSSRLFKPIQELTDQFNLLQDAYSSAEKIFDVLDTIPDVLDEPDAIDLVDFKGKIEFKHVWFYYKEDEWILKDISFVINPGEVCAFVGITGSGKSTIINLIVRNWDIIKGEILIDDIPIKKIKLTSLRGNIGQMLQDVFVFNDTVFNNITLGDSNITKLDAIEAAKYVGAHDFINRLPGNYDYMVQERGNNFSSGQRQLLSFARAVSHSPKFLILDEATSSIDSESEEIIQTSLDKIMVSHTMVIVAHRLSTIQHANNIMVIKKGEIAEQGNHQQLLRLNGIYKGLYDLQKEGDHSKDFS